MCRKYQRRNTILNRTGTFNINEIVILSQNKSIFIEIEIEKKKVNNNRTRIQVGSTMMMDTFTIATLATTTIT